jgi:hypothetical protein
MAALVVHISDPRYHIGAEDLHVVGARGTDVEVHIDRDGWVEIIHFTEDGQPGRTEATSGPLDCGCP